MYEVLFSNDESIKFQNKEGIANPRLILIGLSEGTLKLKSKTKLEKISNDKTQKQMIYKYINQVQYFVE